MRVRSPLVTLLAATVVLAGCKQMERQHAANSTPGGAELFQQHCVSCHGALGHGDGPMASKLDVRVPDLTRIASRNGGNFPAEQVFRIIDGQWQIPAHRPMPTWGYEFFGEEGDDETTHREATQRVDALVAYLARIQRP